MPQLRTSFIRSYPSSTMPLQSSSIMLQLSSVGPVPPVQEREPPLQCCVPALHAPTLRPHDAPLSGSPLSVTPSQSSSSPLQCSAVGPVAPTQTSAPAVQV